MKILNRIKNAIRNFYVLYADSTEMLDKAQKLLGPYLKIAIWLS